MTSRAPGSPGSATAARPKGKGWSWPAAFCPHGPENTAGGPHAVVNLLTTITCDGKMVGVDPSDEAGHGRHNESGDGATPAQGSSGCPGAGRRAASPRVDAASASTDFSEVTGILWAKPTEESLHQVHLLLRSAPRTRCGLHAHLGPEPCKAGLPFLEESVYRSLTAGTVCVRLSQRIRLLRHVYFI